MQACGRVHTRPQSQENNAACGDLLGRAARATRALLSKDHDEAKDLVYSAAADGVPGAQEALDTMKLGPRIGLGWKTKKKKKKVVTKRPRQT